jgi:hypothetical protein
MNIEITKYELINKLMNTTDEGLLEKLVSVFKQAGNKTEPISIAQYNQELEAAESRIKSGKFATQEDLEIESEEW